MKSIFSRHRDQPVRTIVIDWPWKFSDALPGKTRGAAKNYNVMSHTQVNAWRATWNFTMANDVHLLFWKVAAMPQEALDIVRNLEFKIKTELVWRKLSKTGEKEHFGMGRHVRAMHETCLIAVRGKPKVLQKSTRSVFDAPYTGVHSQKPDEFYSLVERTFPGPYVEFFSRKTRCGWRQYGNELGKLDGGA